MISQTHTVYSLGLDPGKNNFAWAFTRTTRVGGKLVPELLATGYVTSPIQNLTEDDLLTGTENFFFDFRMILIELYHQYGQIDIVIAERYQARGARVGTVAEVVGIMLGVLIRCIRECHFTPQVKLVTAGTWKNLYNRTLDDKQAIKKAYALCGAEAHELDASFIGLFGASRVLAQQGPKSRVKTPHIANVYNHFTKEASRDLWLSQIEHMTQGKLTKRRARRNYHSEAPDAARKTNAGAGATRSGARTT